MGNVVGICISSERGTAKQPVKQAEFVKGFGIKGDAHGGNWHRQVSILPLDKIEDARKCGIDIRYGDFGENLVADGIDFENMRVGTKIRIGDVILKMTQQGKSCHTECEIGKRIGECIMPKNGVFFEVIKSGTVSEGDKIEVLGVSENEPFTAAVITLSDSALSGEREDISGKVLAEILEENGYTVIEKVILSDDLEPLKKKLCYFADQRQVDVIFTTGGTGFSRRDNAPEAVIAVCDRMADGISEAIRAHSMNITKKAMLSRGKSGIRKNTLIINLPGSPAAVRESLDAVLGSLEHGIEVLKGRAHNCAREEKKEEYRMKEISVDDAAGHYLCHDVTRIIRGVEKGTLFRKGHIIKEEDIPLLKSIGKFNLFVWENRDDMLHENDGAEILCEICKGENLDRTDVREGKIELIAACDGVLKIDRKKLIEINSLGQMMIASRQGDFPVKKGDKIAGTRIIPLVIEKEKMEKAKRIAQSGHIFDVKPYIRKKVGVVTTGREVYEGLIEDTFTPVIREKLLEYDTDISEHILCNDDKDMIAGAIEKLIEKGCDLILCTGGMSVDPDDMTPYAIRKVTGDNGIYGAPVLPGAMFMISYYGKEKKPVLGLPGCVMYAGRTIFDIVLPRIMVGEIITEEDIQKLGEGGLCLQCSVCTFPNCGFGK